MLNDRYGSSEMVELWSEPYKHRLWRAMWLCLAKTQHQFYNVDDGRSRTLRWVQLIWDNREDVLNLPIDITKLQEMERFTRHELEAARRLFSSDLSQYLSKNHDTDLRPYLHLEATSSDIQDNADYIRMEQSMSILKGHLERLLRRMASFVEEWADFPCLGYTHFQPAEPTTIGYRMASHLYELWRRYEVIPEIETKGVRGAVGTSASFLDFLNGHYGFHSDSKFQYVLFGYLSELVGSPLKPPISQIVTQTGARFSEYDAAEWCGKIAMALSRFALNIRLLSGFGEMSEEKQQGQVGSSAMPHKTNPIRSESIGGLSRVIHGNISAFWDMCADVGLERTLDDSSLRRLSLPAIFILTDEILIKANDVMSSLYIHKDVCTSNLHKNGHKAISSRVLNHLLRRSDMTRADLHLKVGEMVDASNSSRQLAQIVHEQFPNMRFPDYMFDEYQYIGLAKERARELSDAVCKRIT